MVKSKHVHPNPLLNRLTNYGAVTVSLIMVVSAPLQISLTLLGAPGGLFVITALVTLALVLPVLMLTTATPAVTVTQDALILEPVIWRNQNIPWEQIQTIKPYPLLPQPDSETQRRLLEGRATYRAAEGTMLVIPGLPPIYRITGFFAGEGGRPVIAVTNRTHTEYEKLLKKITYYVGEAGD